jgi:hypothetical protein
MKSQYNVQAADSVFDKVEALSKEEELKNKQDNQQEAENTGAIDDKNDIEEHDDSPSQETQADEKLSKKERKERRKRAKYEAELKEIEDNQVTQADVNGAQTGMSENTEIKEGGRLKKKHKKEETVSKNGISEDTELAKGKKSKKKQIDTGVTDIGDAEVSESGVSKKKRKKGQDAAEDMCRQEEPTKKKLKRNGKYSVNSLKIGSLRLKFVSSYSLFCRLFQRSYIYMFIPVTGSCSAISFGPSLLAHILWNVIPMLVTIL